MRPAGTPRPVPSPPARHTQPCDRRQLETRNGAPFQSQKAWRCSETRRDFTTDRSASAGSARHDAQGLGASAVGMGSIVMPPLLVSSSTMTPESGPEPTTPASRLLPALPLLGCNPGKLFFTLPLDVLAANSKWAV